MSSDESILSVTGSVVIEENASSGGEDSSQDSGVYKNIIINLSNLAGSDPNATGYYQQQSANMETYGQGHSSFTSPMAPNNGSNSSGSRNDQELVGILKKTK